MKHLRRQEEIIARWKGDHSRPIISICCLTYNHQDFIKDALEGFLIQETDFPFEILIHDDASLDKTQSIIKFYEKRYPKIIKAIYQKENQYSKGVNVGFKFNLGRARGNYIALCEGDDFWVDPNKLQIQKDFLDGNSEYAICFTDINFFDENKILDEDFGGARIDLSALDLQKASSINTPTVVFRNVLRDNPVEFCNARYGDLTIWSRLGDYGKGKYIPSIKPSMYRVHQGGVHSMQTREKKLQMRLETMMGLYSYRLKRSDHELADFFLEEVVIQALKLRKFGLIKKLMLRLFRSMMQKIFRIFDR